jgi:type II secretory pathway pseudopilin PulG
MNSNSIRQTLIDLRKPLLIATCLIGLSAALFSSSFVYFSQLKRAYESTQQAFRTIQQGVSAAKADIETAQKYTAAFKVVSDSSANGDFAKQRALDHLEQELSANIVIPKSYALAARETLTSAEYAGLEKYEVSKHTVMMEVQLPHELRLLNFIHRMIASNPGGITTMEACEMTMAKKEGTSELKKDEKEAAPALNARCQLTWYRFDPKALVQNNGLPGLNNPSLPNSPLNAAAFGTQTGKK